jgi:hypothetical protein
MDPSDDLLSAYAPPEIASRVEQISVEIDPNKEGV